jgi:PAS domain S-box-containing protein
LKIIVGYCAAVDILECNLKLLDLKNFKVRWCYYQPFAAQVVFERLDVRQMVRRLLPVSFSILVLILLLARLGAKAGLYSVAFAPSIFTIVSLAVTGVAAWFVAVLLDRTDQQHRRSLDALREAEARYRDLYENAPDAMASIDASTGQIVDCNRALEELSGRNKDELLGSAFLDLYHPDSLSDAKGAFEAFSQTGDVHNVELKIRGKRGNAIDISMNMKAVLDTHGHIRRGQAIWRDIRERKRIEEERIQLLMREREVLLEGRESHRIKEEFLRILSHELRTPLTSIMGWAKVLQTHDVSQGKLSHGLDVIFRNAKLEARLVAKVLDMSAMLSGEVPTEIETVDIQAVVRNAVNSIRSSVMEKRLDLVMEIQCDEARIQGNSARLHEMLAQVLSNAIKFTPPGGHIKVTLNAFEKYIDILVVDTGIGIHPDFLPYVFDRFRQADSSPTRRHGGLGLGLAIVRSIVQLHGGNVTAKSEGEGKGTSVSVKLPRKRAKALIQAHR